MLLVLEIVTINNKQNYFSPKFLNYISDKNLRLWSKTLHSKWKDLGRKIKDDVLLNSELYSIIYVPNAVIVPGGRFREYYYW